MGTLLHLISNSHLQRSLGGVLSAATKVAVAEVNYLALIQKVLIRNGALLIGLLFVAGFLLSSLMVIGVGGCIYFLPHRYPQISHAEAFLIGIATLGLGLMGILLGAYTLGRQMTVIISDYTQHWREHEESPTIN